MTRTEIESLEVGDYLMEGQGDKTVGPYAITGIRFRYPQGGKMRVGLVIQYQPGVNSGEGRMTLTVTEGDGHFVYPKSLIMACSLDGVAP